MVRISANLRATRSNRKITADNPAFSPRLQDMAGWASLNYQIEIKTLNNPDSRRNYVTSNLFCELPQLPHTNEIMPKLRNGMLSVSPREPGSYGILSLGTE